jgi:hypothetical protein
MSALARSDSRLVKAEPTVVRRPRPSGRPRPSHLGTRYLGFTCILAVAAGLTFKSELLSPDQVWYAVAGLDLVTLAGLLFMHRRNRTPAWLSPDHYITPMLAVAGGGAFSILSPDWRLHTAAIVGMGIVMFSSSYVDLCRGIGRNRPLHRFLRDSTTFIVLLALFYLILQSEAISVIKFLWIFVIALLSGYRSFRFSTEREGLALLTSFLTAGTVAFGAFGMITYLSQGAAYVAVCLAFVWYAWQGFLVHALDDSLSRRVAFEYGLFALIGAYLVALAQLTR